MTSNKMLNGVIVQLTNRDIVEIEESKAIWASKSGERVRAERDMKLATEVDPIAGNALRWAALDVATQATWAAYRQALLDIPAQAGFPHNVTWPEVPSV